MTKKLFNPHIFGNDLTEARIAIDKCLKNVEMIGLEIVRCKNGVHQRLNEAVIPLDNVGLKHEDIISIAFPKGDGYASGAKFKLYKKDHSTLEPYQLSLFVLRNIVQELMGIYDKI